MGKQAKEKKQAPNDHSRRRSLVWTYCSDLGNGRAQCNICWRELVYRNGSTYNLKRHMLTKHGSAEQSSLAKVPTNGSDEEAASASTSMSVAGARGRKSMSMLKRGTLKLKPVPDKVAAAVRAALAGAEGDLSVGVNGQCDLGTIYKNAAAVTTISSSKRNSFDQALLEMIAVDFHRLSIVDDAGFRRFVSKLQPMYKLPTRQVLFDTLLEQQYTRALNERRIDVQQATSVCLSAEGWTALNGDHYIALTAHYLGPQLDAKSCLLDCFAYNDKHSAVEIKDELVRIAEQWCVHTKVIAVVSDANQNIITAVQLAGWPHMPCFAQTLNLIAEEALKEIVDITSRVRAIVDYFRRNADATSTLKNVLQQLLLPDRDLVQDYPSCQWNMTYRMFHRMVEMREPVVSSLALMVEDGPDCLLGDADWDVVSLTCDLLKPTYEVTSELSSERYSLASKIILMARGLVMLCQKQLNIPTLPPVVRRMSGIMLASMSKLYTSLESSSFLAEAMLLDPRFKRSGFADDSSADRTVNSIVSLASRGLVASTEESIAFTVSEPDGTISAQLPSSLVPTSSIWSDYDQRVYIIVQQQNPAAEAQAQVRQFLEEPLVPRQDNCLEWWQSRSAIYSRLVDVVRERLCIVATSVPCDRMYSKSGAILNDRRSRLDQSEVRQLVFLNANMVLS